MNQHIISVELTKASIANALKELKSYQKWMETKTTEFLNELAKEVLGIMSVKFRQAIYDGTNDVTCSMEHMDAHYIALVAVGSSVLFIEFGTGVYYTANQHPESAEHGMIRGAYGHKLGSLKTGWRYKGNPGAYGEPITEGKHTGEVHTLGNPANQCMYLTVRELESRFEEIAKKVFQA